MLTAARIALAPLRTEDAPLLWQWINDRDGVLLNAPYRPISEAEHRAWFEGRASASTAVIFGIRVPEGDRLVGSCQLFDIHPVHRNAMLQIRIGDPRDRGKGYGTEAVELLLRHAFRDLNLHRVALHVFASNAPALRAYEKAGFRREGLLRQAAHVDGAFVDIAVLSVLRDEHHDSA